MEVPEAALAISRGRYWPRCGLSAGAFQADLSSQRRLWERKLITVLMAAKVTRQVRLKILVIHAGIAQAPQAARSAPVALKTVEIADDSRVYC